MKKISTFIIIILTICLFVGCSSSPKEEKTVTFQFVEDGNFTYTYTKVFTENKWDEVLIKFGKITIGDTEYTIGWNEEEGAYIHWKLNEDYLLMLDISSKENAIFLSSEDEIIDGMTVYCYCGG